MDHSPNEPARSFSPVDGQGGTRRAQLAYRAATTPHEPGACNRVFRQLAMTVLCSTVCLAACVRNGVGRRGVARMPHRETYGLSSARYPASASWLRAAVNNFTYCGFPINARLVILFESAMSDRSASSAVTQIDVTQAQEANTNEYGGRTRRRKRSVGYSPAAVGPGQANRGSFFRYEFIGRMANGDDVVDADYGWADENPRP